MTGKKQIDLGTLRFGDAEFDRVMRKALQVAPPAAPKAKGARKSKTAGKKKAKH